MNEPTPQPDLREVFDLVADLAGADDATAESLTRLGTQMRGGTANQADFDTAQDAFDDATGRPRRKHQHPVVWKIRHWWDWHITSPIIYPLLDLPSKIGAAIRKVTGRKLAWMRVDAEGHLHFEEKTWYEVRRQRRQMRADGGEQQ